jgi:hypothetical protein
MDNSLASFGCDLFVCLFVCFWANPQHCLITKRQVNYISSFQIFFACIHWVLWAKKLNIMNFLLGWFIPPSGLGVGVFLKYQVLM